MPMTFYLSQSQRNSQLSQPLSIQEATGQDASMTSETKDNAVLAGLLLLLRLFQTDSVLLQADQSMSSFPHKIWSLATTATWVAMEDTWTEPGNTSKEQVLLQIHASHTLPETVLAPPHAQDQVLSQNTSASLDPLLLLDPFPKFNLKFTKTVPWKLDSQSTLISTTTDQVFTDTLPVALLVDTPLKSLVGELITGSAPTHGAKAGEKTDSSELPLDNAVLTALSTLANHKSEQVDLYF